MNLWSWLKGSLAHCRFSYTWCRGSDGGSKSDASNPQSFSVVLCSLTAKSLKRLAGRFNPGTELTLFLDAEISVLLFCSSWPNFYIHKMLQTNKLDKFAVFKCKIFASFCDNERRSTSVTERYVKSILMVIHMEKKLRRVYNKWLLQHVFLKQTQIVWKMRAFLFVAAVIISLTEQLIWWLFWQLWYQTHLLLNTDPKKSGKTDAGVAAAESHLCQAVSRCTADKIRLFCQIHSCVLTMMSTLLT